MMAAHPYFGHTAVLATMHGKEMAIRKPFRERLGLEIITAETIDTDVFGTFTGEVRRAKGVKDTAIAKARLGMKLTGLPIGIASEGSFGPHPEIPIIPADMELMVLVDDERDLVLTETLISNETNFAHIEVEPGQDIDSFLDRVKFPSHGLIASPNKPLKNNSAFAKGLTDRDSLRSAIDAAARNSFDGKAIVQTDMRAHFNPMRMNVLGKLAEKLSERMMDICSACGAPGFGRVDVERGLPCSYCATPTHWIKAEIFGCAGCGLRETRKRSDGLEVTGRESCPSCNP